MKTNNLTEAQIKRLNDETRPERMRHIMIDQLLNTYGYDLEMVSKEVGVNRETLRRSCYPRDHRKYIPLADSIINDLKRLVKRLKKASTPGT
jgi:hypothetical protein